MPRTTLPAAGPIAHLASEFATGHSLKSRFLKNTPMELHQIRYFLALCEERNFTRAARRCGVSQPSLSNAIKRLEVEFGGQLFHRNRVNCSLSELGQELRPHLAKLDQCASDARERAAWFLASRAPRPKLCNRHLRRTA
jgi:hypothetical protein